MPDLFHLIRFGFGASRLQVQDFFDTLLAENVMTSVDALLEFQLSQKLAKILERDIGISRSPKNIIENFVNAGHDGYAERQASIAS